LDKTQVRDAATVILVRDPGGRPAVLMGQRGKAAAFMPDKFVFPGGALDPSDAAVPLAASLAPGCAARLVQGCDTGLAAALPATAIRELWEETGLVLGAPGAWDAPLPDWTGFAATGHRPSAQGLSFVFRAITPPGRPRRFDARFFLADAAAVRGDPDDFSRASDELSALQWIPIADARRFDLPFITRVVLAEVSARLPDLAPPQTVPFFRNDDEESLFLRIGGTAP
jgi:8-oxo-dGTP pyrophosphatase MutT (NUDIX family)